MARIARKHVVDPDEVGAYHCVGRCVRRAFLCGFDRFTGNSFEHRREWIARRLEFLAGEMGVDSLGFAVMQNHLHVILRNGSDVVRNWSDEDCVRRWLAISNFESRVPGLRGLRRGHELRSRISRSGGR